MGKALSVVLAACLLAGCGGPSAYQRVFKNSENRNAKTYPTVFDTCWLAVTRAALGLNFGLDQQDKDKGFLQASRHFREGKRTTSLTLKASLQPEGNQQTTVYLNATQTSEKVFARSHRRFFLWLIPLPGGGGVTASRIAEGEDTLEDEKFYQAFFDAIGKELYTLEKARVAE